MGLPVSTLGSMERLPALSYLPSAHSGCSTQGQLRRLRHHDQRNQSRQTRVAVGSRTHVGPVGLLLGRIQLVAGQSVTDIFYMRERMRSTAPS